MTYRLHYYWLDNNKFYPVIKCYDSNESKFLLGNCIHFLSNNYSFSLSPSKNSFCIHCLAWNERITLYNTYRKRKNVVKYFQFILFGFMVECFMQTCEYGQDCSTKSHLKFALNGREFCRAHILAFTLYGLTITLVWLNLSLLFNMQIYLRCFAFTASQNA